MTEKPIIRKIRKLTRQEKQLPEMMTKTKHPISTQMKEAMKQHLMKEHLTKRVILHVCV